MRKHLFYTLLILGILSDLFSVQAQKTNTDPCRQLIRKAYKKIDVSGKSSDNSTFIHYTTRINMWNPEETPNSETEIKLLSTNKQIHFLTKEASFYSDDKDVFLVVRRSNDLIRSKAILTSKEENFFIKQASLIKDSLLLTSTTSVCQEIKQADGSIFTKIELIPPAKTRRLHKIISIVFTIDKTTETIKTLQINYTKESPIKQIDNSYHSIDTNYKIKLNTPVYYLFFDKRNNLLPKYKEFNYIDNTL